MNVIQFHLPLPVKQEEEKKGKSYIWFIQLQCPHLRIIPTSYNSSLSDASSAADFGIPVLNKLMHIEVEQISWHGSINVAVETKAIFWYLFYFLHPKL
jgi:hypothetical protein